MSSRSVSGFVGSRKRGIRFNRGDDYEEEETKEVYTVPQLFSEFNKEGSKLSEEEISTIANSWYGKNLSFFSVDANIDMKVADAMLNFEFVSNLVEAINLSDKKSGDEILDLVNACIDDQSLLSTKVPEFFRLKEEIRENQEIETKVEGRDDIGVCKSCAGTIIIVRSQQTSRGDEATSIIYNCASCGAGKGRLKIF